MKNNRSNEKHKTRSMRTMPQLVAQARAVIIGMMVAFTVTLADTTAATAASLFGDTPCERWASMEFDAKQRWTLAFLAPLSMAHEDRQKTGEDKFNSRARSAERAMASIDSYCTANPGKGAADGAAAHLESLVGTR